MRLAPPRESRLAVIGHGWVGRALDHLLEQSRRELADRHGAAYRTTVVATRRAGILINESGVTAEQVTRALAIYDEAFTVVEAI